MNTQIFINNLKYLKRRLKEAPELARQALAHARGPMRDWSKAPLRVDSPSRPYRPRESAVPVSTVSPDSGHYMTTFFDVDPFSPSGRFLAVTQVPFIERIPIPGDKARVCVIDLVEGGCEVVHETLGWGAQLGANVQWGSSDDILYCNDVVEGRATGVRIERAQRKVVPLDGPVYGLSPDRRYSYAPDIEYVNAIIPGYGVADPLTGKKRQTTPLSSTEGIWRTDLVTGERKLLVSLRDIVECLPDQSELAGSTYYVFNVKVNPTNTKLFAVLFCTGVRLRGGTPVQLVTMNLDGSNIKLAMPDALWRVGGHHPNWTPDGEHILMNLRPKGKPMAFVRFKADGTCLETVAPGHKGSGHPSLDPSGRFLVTDSYVSEGFRNSQNDIPLRLIDLETNKEQALCWIHTKNLNGPRRIDPHPVWSSDGTRIAFNGIVDGFRQVLIADTRQITRAHG